MYQVSLHALTTTRSPLARSTARCTWPMEAQPSGASSNSEKTSPSGTPSSSSTTAAGGERGRLARVAAEGHNRRCNRRQPCGSRAAVRREAGGVAPRISANGRGGIRSRNG